MATQHFDLAIIGSGSGNSLVTPYWDDKRVAIFEASDFGGTCLNKGCIPTKMFAYPAKLAAAVEHASELGIEVSSVRADWERIRDRVFGRIDPISESGRDYRDKDCDNVTLFAEEVSFEDSHTLVTASGSRVTADHIVVAAGSRPTVPDVPGADLPGVYTSDTVMRMEKLPKSMVVLGGGFIAAEFASIFSAFGVDVTQINRSNLLLRSHDHDIAERFTEAAKRQWTVRTGLTLQSIEQTAEQVGAPLRVLLESESASGEDTVVQADAVLIAYGRTPNTDRLSPAAAGLKVRGNGRLEVDRYQRLIDTNGNPVDGLWALGDISNDWQLKHVANYEQRLVSHNIENPGRMRENDNLPVPAAVFARPEIGSVGLTEAEAAEEYGSENIAVKVQSMGDVAYGWAMEDRDGICKLIAKRDTGEILGAHILGHEAANLIQPLVQAMTFGVTAQHMARGQYWPHPALTEVIENALLGLDLRGDDPEE